MGTRYIRADRLFDGTSHETRKDAMVAIENGRVAAIMSKDDLPDQVDLESDVMEFSGCTILPGLIDCHVHTRGTGDLRQPGYSTAQVLSDLPGTIAFRSWLSSMEALKSGYTTLRDQASLWFADIALRDAIQSGMLPGPRIKAAGLGLTSSGGHMDRTKGLIPGVSIPLSFNIVDGPDEARRATRQLINYGVDHIKINATMSETVRQYGELCAQEMTYDTMAAICEVAHAHFRPVSAHCHGGPGVDDAIRAGVDSLEHGRFLTREQLEVMKEQGIALVPTLCPEGRAIAKGQSHMGSRDVDWAWTVKANNAMYSTVALAHEVGVEIGAGSDASMPLVRHGENAFELELLVRAGLTPSDALLSATSIAARILCIEEDVGTIEPGKIADIVIVEGNPLDDIRLLQDRQNIRAVLQSGKLLDRDFCSCIEEECRN